MVDLGKLSDEYKDQGVAVIVVGYSDKHIVENPDSYKNIREAFAEQPFVKLLFDPSFDPPRSFEFTSKRTTWILDQQRNVLFEDFSLMSFPHHVLSSALRECFGEARPEPLKSLDTLPDEIGAEQLLTQEEVDSTLRGLRVVYDDFSETHWYYDQRTPRYNNRDSIHLYIGKGKASIPWLRFRIQYAADSWLFIEEYSIKADGKYYTIVPGFNGVERDNGYGGIWEWYDCSPDQHILNIVDAIVAADKAQIRFLGQQYSDTRTISNSEKKALQNVLEAYDILLRAAEQGLDTD